MSLIIISCVLRLVLTGVMAYELYRFEHMLNAPERIGMGLIGGMCLMTIFVVADVKKEGTPFDDWVGVGFVSGFLIFFSGRIIRQLKHDRNNKLQIRMWEEEKRERGSERG